MYNEPANPASKRKKKKKRTHHISNFLTNCYEESQEMIISYELHERYNAQTFRIQEMWGEKVRKRGRWKERKE